MNTPSIHNGVYVSQYHPQIPLSRESSDILQRLKKINASYFFQPDNVLVSKLKVVNPVELTKILNCFFMEMVQEERIRDPVKFLDRLAAVIPLTRLQQAVKGDVDDVLKEAKVRFEEAKLYLQMTQGKTSPSIRARLSSILDGIISAIESIIKGFGIGVLLKPAESELHADFNSQKIMTLLSLFSMITTMILPILGAAEAGVIIAAILLAISILSILWPFIKPMTTYLPANAENWTKQIQNGCPVAQGRKEALNEIADILKMNRHAILVGPSRVGKFSPQRLLLKR